jgi:hypothetical protein
LETNRAFPLSISKGLRWLFESIWILVLKDLVILFFGAIILKCPALVSYIYILSNDWKNPLIVVNIFQNSSSSRISIILLSDAYLVYHYFVSSNNQIPYSHQYTLFYQSLLQNAILSRLAMDTVPNWSR